MNLPHRCGRFVQLVPVGYFALSSRVRGWYNSPMPTRAAQYRRSPPPAAAPRPSAHQRGYGVRWRAYRRAYLAEHPLCELCKQAGRVTAAEHVHHLDLLGPTGARGYDPSNLQALCESHHNSISGKKGSS